VLILPPSPIGACRCYCCCSAVSRCGGGSCLNVTYAAHVHYTRRPRRIADLWPFNVFILLIIDGRCTGRPVRHGRLTPPPPPRPPDGVRGSGRHRKVAALTDTRVRRQLCSSRRRRASRGGRAVAKSASFAFGCLGEGGGGSGGGKSEGSVGHPLVEVPVADDGQPTRRPLAVPA